MKISTKNKTSKRILALFLSFVLMLTSVPIFALAEDQEYETDAEATSSYANYVDGYSAEYADPNNNNAITAVGDPYYQQNFGTLSSLSEISSVNSNADISTAGERTEALHLGAATSAPGGYMTFDTNPVSGKDLSNGVTLMAWEYYTYDKSDVDYVPLITFYGVPSDSFLSNYGLSTDDTNGSDNYWYVSFTLGGYILISKGAIDGNNSYNNYVDYTVDGSTDIVGVPYTATTVTTKNTETWSHYAFTVTSDAIRFFCGGTEYEFSSSAGSAYDTTVGSADEFDYVLDFITDSSVKCSLGYGLGYFYNDYDQYIDDFRIYDSALTQQAIRAVYGENDDSVYKYAEGHDPTIVYNETKSEGEFNYYMFGTGMTIYGSDDLANWYELADSDGNTGYQSTKLFGDDYTNVLGSSGTNLSSAGGVMPLDWSSESDSYTNDGSSSHYGRGQVVWAPSVIYNESTGKWQMYAATSSWGSTVSCIFVAESDSGIEGPYDEVYTILYSGFKDTSGSNSYTNLSAYVDTSNNEQRNYLYSSWFSYYYDSDNYPNCIDATPFYDEDGNLYMSYGSWSGGIWMVKLTNDGRYLDNGNSEDSDADPYYGTKVVATTSETTGSGSGEGSYVYYDADTGYYYMTVSFGAVHQYKYTMRVWRSTSVTGPYVDATDTASTTASTDDDRSGQKLMGNYNFTGTGSQYYDNGHSSNLIVPSDSETNEAGKQFIAYHTRMYDGYRTERSYASTNYLNEARVHQVIMNQSGWQCILPYQYSGETFGDDGFTYSAANLSGTWSFILFVEEIQSDYEKTVSIKLSQDGTVSGNYSGTWELTKVGDKPYLTMTLSIDGTDVVFEGVFITMTNELGEGTTVFSAVGETDGYSTIAWGAMQEALSPASQAADADLTCLASDGYDNIIYTHGTNTSTSYGTGSSSDYIYYGNEISDGTVASTTNATYPYEYTRNAAGDNNGYEQGERATYIYIADKYDVDTSADALSDDLGDKITATEVTSDKDGYNKYVLSGTIADASSFNDMEDFINITLVVPYTDSTGSEYNEYIYATVMPNPVSAHAATDAVKTTSLSSQKMREASAFLRADGSTGTTTLVGTDTRGVYAYVDNPVYLYGVCGYAFATNTGYLWNSSSASVVQAGSYWNSNSSSTTASVTNTEGATVTATYYLDLSKLDDDTADQELGGLTVDTNEDTLSFNLLSTELPARSVKEFSYGDQPSGRTQSYTLTDGSVFTWTVDTSTYDGSVTPVQNEQFASDVEMQYATSTISADYTSIRDASATTVQTLSDTATFTENQGGTTSPYRNANSVIGITVKVFDKSAIYDVLQEYKDMQLVMSDYTDETREDYEEAIAKATWYCNNYKLFDYDTDGNYIEDLAAYYEELEGDIDYAYENLFSYTEFETYYEIYQQAVAMYSLIQNETLVGDDAVIREALENAITAYEAFSTYSETGEVFDTSTWANVKDYDTDGETYAPNFTSGYADDTLRAKYAFNYACYELLYAMQNVRSLTDYSALESELYGMTGVLYSDIVDDTYGATDATSATSGDSTIYVDNYSTLGKTGTSKSIIVNCSDDDYNQPDYESGQVYTVSTWVPFADAYTTALKRSKQTKLSDDSTTEEANSADNIKDYRSAEYKYALSSTTDLGFTLYGYYETDSDGKYDDSTFSLTDSYDENGNLIETELDFTVQSAEELSYEQEEIDAATEALKEARIALTEVGTEESYDAYNEAQRIAAKADVDAYNANAQTDINANFALGYIDSNGDFVNVDEYTSGTEDVYVLYNGYYYKNTTTTQNDSYTTSVLNTINEENNLSLYDVYFTVYIDGSKAKDTELVGSYRYGASVTFDGSEYNTGAYAIAKWTVQSNNADESVLNSQNDENADIYSNFTLEREIQQDTYVSLYLTRVPTYTDGDGNYTDSSGNALTKVTVMDYYGTQLDVAWVSAYDANSTYDGTNFNLYNSSFSDETITFVDYNNRTHTVTAIQSAYYTFTNWHWANTDDGVVIIQKGTLNLPTATVTVANGSVSSDSELTEGTAVVDDGTTYEEVELNTVLTFTTDVDKFVAWVKSTDGTNWYVASYNSTFTTFSRPTGIVYRAVTSDDTNATNYVGTYITDEETLTEVLTYAIPFSFGTAVDTVNVNGTEKFRLYCDYSVDSGSNIEIVQYGVLATKASTLSSLKITSGYSDYITKGASGITTVAANADSSYNTYTCTTSVGTSTIYMRSFVSYIYKDAAGNEYPRVAYGPVYACDSDGNITEVTD